jgi:hypothetical protein
VTATGRLGDSGEAQRLIKTLGFIGVVQEPSASINIGPVAANPPRPELALLDKPSIAVLPFANLSGDPKQEYFADGMVEEIITVLTATPYPGCDPRCPRPRRPLSSRPRMAVVHQFETAPRNSARRRITHHCARQRWLMALSLPEYEDRDVGLAALIEGSDEVGVEKDPEIIAIARTRHLSFAVRVAGGRSGLGGRWARGRRLVDEDALG